MFRTHIKLFLICILLPRLVAAKPQAGSMSRFLFPLTKYVSEIGADNTRFVDGFRIAISGKTMSYPSPFPGDAKALITRANSGDMAIEWETAPSEFDKDIVHFVWSAGMGVNIGVKDFDLYVDREKILTFSTRKETGWEVSGKNHIRLRFYTIFIDEYHDYFGYMILSVPGEKCNGQPLRIKIIGGNAGSDAWYMTFEDSGLAEKFRRTAADGFWYRAEWPADHSTLMMSLPRNCSGRIIELEDADGFRLQDKLLPKPDVSYARFSLSANRFRSLKFPLLVKLDDRIIDRLDSLAGMWQAREYFDDGMMVFREKAKNQAGNFLECSGNYLIDSPVQVTSAGDSYFKNGTIHLISSSHQDIAWMDSPENCMIMRDTLVITPALKLLERDPDYHYSAEQVLMLDEYLSRHPEKLKEIIRFTKEKRLEWGAGFNQPYEGMYSGESLVRQFYFGRKWLRKILPGCDSRVAFNVDVPGRTLQMAQIMKRSGVRYLILSRHKQGLFYWQSPDGSRIAAYSPGHYHWASQFLRKGVEHAIMSTPGILKKWQPEFEKYKLAPHLPVIFTTDMSRPHDFSDYLEQWNHLQLHYKNRQRPVALQLPAINYDIAENVMEKIFEGEPNLPVIQGERPNVWLYIHGPTHHKAISASRSASGLLTAAEKFSTISALLSGNFSQYPAAALSLAWKSHIYPDHGWGGKNGQVTDHLFLKKSEFARDEGKRLLRKALREISRKIKTRPSLGYPITVFNSLSWERDDPVSCSIEFEKGEASAVALFDNQNRSVPFEIGKAEKYRDGSLKKVDLTFLAGDVPSIGYKTYYAKPVKKIIGQKKKWKFTSDQYENQFYKITFTAGGIKQVYDKRLHRSLFRTDKFLVAELFTMRSEGNGAGEFAEIQQPSMTGFAKLSQYKPGWKVVSDGEMATVFSLQQKLPHCYVRQRVTVYRQIKRIDFDVDLLDWDGTKYREFRLAFPLKMRDARITYEVPFGKVTVGEDEIPGAAGERYTQLAREVHPREVQDWINASDRKFGCTLSSSVAVWDYEDPTDHPVAYPVLQPVLLASRRSCHGEGNWYLQKGNHHFRFSLFSHKPGWKQSLKIGKQPNHPLFALVQNSFSGENRLPDKYSFCSVKNDHVSISAIKKCEDDRSVILRFYEMAGEDSDVILNWFGPFDRVEETNLIEEDGVPLNDVGKQIAMRVGHHSIHTIKIALSQR